MPETITLQALDLSGETLTMFLRKSDGSLLNSGGDAMTEQEDEAENLTGVFTATLAESRSGLGPLAVRICAGSETADNLLYDGFLVEGTTVIDSVMRAELDSDARVKLAATQPDYAPATVAALAAVDAKIGTPETSLSAMVGNVPTVAEFEARTLAAASYRQNISLRGSEMTEAKAFDLLLAASAGITSQPSGTTEKFKFLDGNDAFTTTFDTNGNRTGVALA
jgi:hypothetical protein